MMSMFDDITSLLNAVGLPVGITIILMWFIKYQFDNSRSEREEAREDRQRFDQKMIEGFTEIKVAVEQQNRLISEFLRLK